MVDKAVKCNKSEASSLLVKKRARCGKRVADNVGVAAILRPQQLRLVVPVLRARQIASEPRQTHKQWRGEGRRDLGKDREASLRGELLRVAHQHEAVTTGAHDREQALHLHHLTRLVQ